MKKINNEDLLDELKKLKNGETIFISIDKDLCNTIQLLDLQCQSYQNLFQSYINNTCEDANRFNVEKFLELYSNKFSEMHLIMDKILKNVLDDSFEYFLQNPFKYNFDFNLCILIITKMNGGN